MVVKNVIFAHYNELVTWENIILLHVENLIMKGDFL